MDWVSVGYLASSHGIQGEAKVRGFGESWQHLSTPLVVRIQKGVHSCMISLSHVSVKSNYVIIRSSQVQAPEFWREWLGGTVAVPREILETSLPTAQEEYFFYQLEGLSVRDENKTDTEFTVLRVEETPAHPVLILGRKGRQILVPFVKEWIGEVNLKEGFLILKNWEYWLEV